MKKEMLLLIIVSLFIVGCGKGKSEVDSPYDMWLYMVSSTDYEIEYDIYENGNRIDYMIETMKVLGDGLVQQTSSQGDIFLLRRESQHIVLEEVGGETTTVQRYVNVGDQNIMNIKTLGSCYYEAYHRSKIIRGFEFYNVIQINCTNGEDLTIYYYGYDEGLVGFYTNNDSKEYEFVKVDERRL